MGFLMQWPIPQLLNGVEVNKPTDIDRVISEGDIRAGSIVKLKIFRNGNHKMIKMKTAKYK